MGGYEDAMRHAREIAEIQKKKKREGLKISCPRQVRTDLLDRHFNKLRKVLKDERTKELARHPERRITNVAERHRQPIKCIETGQVFHSLNDLAKTIGLTPATISIQMSKKKKIHGYTYIRITKEDEAKENK